MRNSMMIRTHLLAYAVVLSSACAGTDLTPNFPDARFADNRQDDIETVLAALAEWQPPSESNVLVGVSRPDSEGQSQVLAYDLNSKRLLWKKGQTPASVPWIAGDLVVSQEGGMILARQLTTGETMFQAPDEALPLVGAAGSGERAIVTLSTGGGVGAKSVLLLIDGSGTAWTRRLEQAVGVPAFAAGLAFVPWGNQNVSVFSAKNADEIARVRVQGDVVGHVFADHRDIYLGQTAVFRFDTAFATRTPHRLAAPSWELPGRPRLMIDAYYPPPAANDAHNRMRLLWAPIGDAPSFAGGAVLLAFYKQIYGLDVETGKARWAIETERDLAGATVTPTDAWIATEDGSVIAVSLERGTTRVAANVGVPLVAARLRVADVELDSLSRSARPASVRDQLFAAASSHDARLVPARLFAVEQLAALADPEVTQHLIELCEDTTAPAPVHAKACDSLGERTIGEHFIIEALSRHAAFLEGTRAPPVGPLAKAAVAMNARQAVPSLLSQLADPSTLEVDLPAVVEAIKTLGDRSAIEPLTDFLRLYHADAGPAEAALLRALYGAVDALAALAGPVARDVLEEIATDELSAGDLRTRAQTRLSELAPPSNEEGVTTEVATPAQEAPTASNGSTALLSAALIARILTPVEADLARCLREDRSHPPSARIVVAVDGAGAIESVSAAPATLQSCVEPLVRAQVFPGHPQGWRQQVTHVLRRAH